MLLQRDENIVTKYFTIRFLALTEINEAGTDCGTETAR